jgi:hypothetical protein
MEVTVQVGDFVQYRNAYGNLEGYGVVVKKTEYWTVLLDQETGKEIYWSDDLMVKIIP